MNKGIIDEGTVHVDNLLASLRQARTRDITLAGGQGDLKRGTLVQDDGSGKYEVCDDDTKIAGVLLEDVSTGEAGADDVNFYLGFDMDLNKVFLHSGVTELNVGYYPDSGINIKGGN